MFSKIKSIVRAVQLFHLMRKFKGMRICSDQFIQMFADQIGYRAQLALYELHTEQQADLSWDEFVMRVRSNPMLYKKIQQVAGRAVLSFDKTLLNFELPADAFEDRGDGTDKPQIDIARIFSGKLADGLMENVFLTFEMEHFKRLAASIPGYSWAAYCDDLSNDEQLWNQFTRGLQLGLRQIDYEACWNANATQEEILRLEFCERKG